MNALKYVKKYYEVFVFAGILLAPPLQDDLPPISGAFYELATWLLTILMGLLAIGFAFLAYASGRKTQKDIKKHHEEDTPVGETLKKWGAWWLVLALGISTFLLPILLFALRDVIQGMLQFILEWIRNNILDFLPEVPEV